MFWCPGVPRPPNTSHTAVTRVLSHQLRPTGCSSNHITVLRRSSDFAEISKTGDQDSGIPFRVSHTLTHTMIPASRLTWGKKGVHFVCLFTSKCKYTSIHLKFISHPSCDFSISKPVTVYKHVFIWNILFKSVCQVRIRAKPSHLIRSGLISHCMSLNEPKNQTTRHTSSN